MGSAPGRQEQVEVSSTAWADIGAPASVARYWAASPWPHLVLDGVICEEQCRMACAEAEGVDPRLVVRQRTRRIVKDSVTHPDGLGPTTTALLARLHDDATAASLRSLTGIPDLEVDPTYAFGGLWMVPQGGWQRLHQDFVRHPVTRSFNRVVTIAYLSPWEPGDGGELEMWDPAVHGPPALVEPRQGRVAIFEPSSATLHAVRPTVGRRIALGVRWYSPSPPAHPPRPLHRQTVRRPGERRIDVMPTVGEVLRMAARVRVIRRSGHDGGTA